MNEVRLTGRITKELPKVEELTTKPIYISLAVDRWVSGEKKTDFVSIKFFKLNAETLCKFRKKGDFIIVIGHVSSGSYEKDGKKYYTQDIVADRIEFDSSKNNTLASTQTNDFEEISNHQSAFDDVMNFDDPFSLM